MKQDPPFSLHLEPVEGCSLACSFCALQTIRDNGANWRTGKHGVNSAPYRFMELTLLVKIMREVEKLGWNPRVEIDMRGEPTAHPQIVEYVRIVRQALPKGYVVLTTNGSGLIKPGRIDALFGAGLNTLTFDNYKHAKWSAQVHALLKQYAKAEPDVYLYDYPLDKRGNPHQRSAFKRITVLHDISDNHAGTHQLTNQAGNSGALESLDQRCAKPFRDLSISWDGNVTICCDDWRRKYVIGNVGNLGIEGVWQHPRFDAARRLLYRGLRDRLMPCAGCNVRTYRNGLLPDKFGKVAMPAPSPSSMEHAAEAQAPRPVYFIKEMK